MSSAPRSLPERRVRSTSSGRRARADTRRGAVRCTSAPSCRGRPNGHVAETSCRRAQQPGPDDTAVEDLRRMVSQREHGHPAHRVTDHDDRTLGRGSGDHLREVETQPVDVVRALRPPTRTPVPPLVDPHGAHESAEVLTLEVPAVQVEGIPVQEDDGESRVRRGRPRLVDLEVELHPVVEGQGPRRRPQGTVRTGGLAAAERFADHRPLPQPAGGRPDRQQPEPETRRPHASPHCRCTLGTRGPTRVTIS